MSEDRRRVLDMLSEGTITPEQAEGLLRALSGNDAPPPPRPPGAPDVQSLTERAFEFATGGTTSRWKQARRARSLRIHVKRDGDRGDLDVNVIVPLGLVRFASRFVPEEARNQMTASGVNFEELINTINADDGVPEGKLLSLESEEDGNNTSVVIEAV